MVGDMRIAEHGNSGTKRLERCPKTNAATKAVKTNSGTCMMAIVGQIDSHETTCYRGYCCILPRWMDDTWAERRVILYGILQQKAIYGILQLKAIYGKLQVPRSVEIQALPQPCSLPQRQNALLPHK